MGDACGHETQQNSASTPAEASSPSVERAHPFWTCNDLSPGRLETFPRSNACLETFVILLV